MAIDQLGVSCQYDVFHDRIVVDGHETGISGDVVENLENVALKVRHAVLTKFGFDPGSQHLFDAIKMRCLDRIFDSVRDYLDSLQWDGEPRLDDWLIRYCQAEDTALNRAIGRKMLTAAVRRVRTPGCKFDYITVLESEQQGIGKSTMLKTLAGEENFSDAEIIGVDKREQQELIQGVWIYEIAELEGLTKAEVTKVKLFASKTVDMARPAYARSRVDRPRRGILVGTTNDDNYLRDMTGNRRFWPVKLGNEKIDLVGITRDRDQLWAEASAVEATGEGLVIPEALWPDAAVQQQARMGVDPWEDVLATKLADLIARARGIEGQFALASDTLGNPEWRVSSEYLLTHVLSLPKERQFNNHTKRLAGIMVRSLGWTKPVNPIRIGKAVHRGFTKRGHVTGANSM
ncbi:MAG: virulence-associated E family protein [Terriglobales bacterium]